jgi:hypothetical protein
MAEYFTVEFPEVVIEIIVEVAPVDVVIVAIVVVMELQFTKFPRLSKSLSINPLQPIIIFKMFN